MSRERAHERRRTHTRIMCSKSGLQTAAERRNYRSPAVVLQRSTSGAQAAARVQTAEGKKMLLDPKCKLRLKRLQEYEQTPNKYQLLENDQQPMESMSGC